MADEKSEEQVTITPMTPETAAEKMQAGWRRNHPHVAKAMRDAHRSLAALEAALIVDRLGGEPASETDPDVKG